jgi:flavin-dependent dehydrogenase
MKEQQSPPAAVEHVDVVVVGCRPAGSATAITFARAGRRVIAVDRAVFPSDTLSTHVMFAGGVAELKRLGALDRVLAAGAPKCPALDLSADGDRFEAFYSPVDGIDYGLNTRRPELDMALVETTREAGVDLRERCKLTALVWVNGRVGGIRYVDADAAVHEVRAKLVVGADGRDSTVADLLGVAEPYRTSPPGRGLAFHYVEDPLGVASNDPTLRNRTCKWVIGKEAGFFFPTNKDGGLALFMPPVEDIARFRKDPKGVWKEKLDKHPVLKERLAGTVQEGRLRYAYDTDGFFRVSSGPGWALVGDAGSFKDPVIAQGIRDALHYGRVLAEMTADALDDPAWLDRRLRAYEKRRDLGVLRSFYWGMKQTRPKATTPVEREFWREAVRNPRLATDVADTFSRVLDPQQSFSFRRQVTWTLRALRRPGADYRAIAAAVRADLTLDAKLYRDLAAVRRGRRVTPDRHAAWKRDGWSKEAVLGTLPSNPAPEPVPSPDPTTAPTVRARRPAPAAS